MRTALTCCRLLCCLVAGLLLWCAMTPVGAQVRETLDYEQLAREFERLPGSGTDVNRRRAWLQASMGRSRLLTDQIQIADVAFARAAEFAAASADPAVIVQIESFRIHVRAFHLMRKAQANAEVTAALVAIERPVGFGADVLLYSIRGIACLRQEDATCFAAALAALQKTTSRKDQSRVRLWIEEVYALDMLGAAMAETGMTEFGTAFRAYAAGFHESESEDRASMLVGALRASNDSRYAYPIGTSIAEQLREIVRKWGKLDAHAADSDGSAESRKIASRVRLRAHIKAELVRLASLQGAADLSASLQALEKLHGDDIAALDYGTDSYVSGVVWKHRVAIEAERTTQEALVAFFDKMPREPLEPKDAAMREELLSLVLGSFGTFGYPDIDAQPFASTRFPMTGISELRRAASALLGTGRYRETAELMLRAIRPYRIATAEKLKAADTELYRDVLGLVATVIASGDAGLVGAAADVVGRLERALPGADAFRLLGRVLSAFSQGRADPAALQRWMQEMRASSGFPAPDRQDLTTAVADALAASDAPPPDARGLVDAGVELARAANAAIAGRYFLFLGARAAQVSGDRDRVAALLRVAGDFEKVQAPSVGSRRIYDQLRKLREQPAAASPEVAGAPRCNLARLVLEDGQRKFWLWLMNEEERSLLKRLDQCQSVFTADGSAREASSGAIAAGDLSAVERQATVIAMRSDPSTEGPDIARLIQAIRGWSVEDPIKREGISKALVSFDLAGRPLADGALALARATADFERARPSDEGRASALRLSIARELQATLTRRSAGSLALERPSSDGRDAKGPDSERAAQPTGDRTANSSERPRQSRTPTLRQSARIVQQAAAAAIHARTRLKDLPADELRTRVCAAGSRPESVAAISALKAYLTHDGGNPEHAYRLSQLLVLCGSREDATAWLGRGLELAGAGDSPLLALTLRSWHASDLDFAGDSVGAALVRKELATAAQTALSAPGLEFSTGNLRELHRTLEALARSGDDPSFDAIFDLVPGSACSVEDRAWCEQILRLALVTRAAAAERGGANREMASLLASAVKGAPSAARVLKLISGPVVDLFRAGRTAEVDRLLDTVAAPAASIAAWDGDRAADLTLGIAAVAICRQRTQLALDLTGRFVTAIPPEPDESNDNDFTASSLLPLPLGRAVQVDKVFRLLGPVEGAREKWRARGLPSLSDHAAQTATPVDLRILALASAGRFDAALDLASRSLSELRRLPSERRRDSALAFSTSSALLAQLETPNFGRYFELLDHVQAVALRSLPGKDPTIELIQRLRAQAAFLRGQLSVARSLLLDVQAGKVQLTPLGQSAADRANALQRLLAEDLSIAARSAVASSSLFPSSSRGFGLLPAQQFALEQDLIRSQRALLALMLAQDDSIPAQAYARRDASFQLLQATTAGRTAVDLSRAVLRKGVPDAELRDGFVRLLEKLERKFEMASAPQDWPGTTLFSDRPADFREAFATDGCDVSTVTGDRAKRPFGLILDRLAERGALTWRGVPDPGDWIGDDSSSDPTALTGSSEEQRIIERLSALLKGSPMAVPPAALSEVAGRLGPNKAFFAAVTFRHATYAFVLDADGRLAAQEIRLAGAALGQARLKAELEKAWADHVRDAQKPLADSAGDAGAQLFEALFAPFAQQLRNTEELVVSLRGPLEGFPVGALRVGQNSALSRPGISTFEERFAWSIGLVARREVQPGSVSSGPKQSGDVVQFGPPRFSGREPNCGQIGSRIGPARLDQELCGIDGLQTLAESSVVESTPGSVSTRVVAGDRATREVLQELSRGGQLASAKVLIVVTHGLVTEQSMRVGGNGEPALVLARSPTDPTGLPLLTPAEISQLDIRADEVLLVACNSGADSPSQSGEAFSGLVRGFMRAGATSVIAAVLDLPKDTTAYILERYFALRSEGLNPARAMRAAKIELRGKGGALASPRHWAGLVHVGSY